MPEGLPEIATRRQVSDFTQIGVATLARWATEGKGPKFSKFGKAIRYRRADVMAWIEQNAVSEAS